MYKEGGEKSWKVFWVFVFGHLFCPFFKREKTFRHFPTPFFVLHHNGNKTKI